MFVTKFLNIYNIPSDICHPCRTCRWVFLPAGPSWPPAAGVASPSITVYSPVFSYLEAHGHTCQTYPKQPIINK